MNDGMQLKRRLNWMVTKNIKKGVPISCFMSVCLIHFDTPGLVFNEKPADDMNITSIRKSKCPSFPR